MYDLLTLQRIDLMHPSLREELKELYLEINKKLPKFVRLRFAQTHRDSKVQKELYDQGRTKPGKIVTYAAPGTSFHEYGFAFDIVILIDKDKNGTFESISYVNDKNWMMVVDFFKSKGWIWGGDWEGKKRDTPHFQKAGYSIKYLASAKTFVDPLTKIKYPIL